MGVRLTRRWREGDSAPGASRRRSKPYRIAVLRVLDLDLRLRVARFERPDQTGGPEHLPVIGDIGIGHRIELSMQTESAY
jgi:hypothetical protein